MRRASVNAVSVAQTEQIPAQLKIGDKLLLTAFSKELLHMRELAAFRGGNCYITLATDNGILVSIDSSLILFRNQAVETVLKNQS